MGALNYEEQDLDFSRLQITRDKRDIIGLLFKIKKEKTQVVLWQTQDGKRVMARAVISRVDLKEKSFTLKSVDEMSFDFNYNFYLYFHGENYSLLFKDKARLIQKNFLVMRTPNEARMIDKREFPRFRINPGERCDVRILLKESKLDVGSEIPLALSEFSQRGMGFYIKPSQHAKLKFSDSIQILSMDYYSFSIPLKARVIYINGVDKMTGSSAIKMGIELIEYLDPTFMMDVIKGTYRRK